MALDIHATSFHPSLWNSCTKHSLLPKPTVRSQHLKWLSPAYDDTLETDWFDLDFTTSPEPLTPIEASEPELDQGVDMTPLLQREDIALDDWELGSEPETRPSLAEQLSSYSFPSPPELSTSTTTTSSPTLRHASSEESFQREPIVPRMLHLDAFAEPPTPAATSTNYTFLDLDPADCEDDVDSSPPPPPRLARADSTVLGICDVDLIKVCPAPEEPVSPSPLPKLLPPTPSSTATLNSASETRLVAEDLHADRYANLPLPPLPPTPSSPLDPNRRRCVTPNPSSTGSHSRSGFSGRYWKTLPPSPPQSPSDAEHAQLPRPSSEGTTASTKSRRSRSRSFEVLWGENVKRWEARRGDGPASSGTRLEGVAEGEGGRRRGRLGGMFRKMLSL